MLPMTNEMQHSQSVSYQDLIELTAVYSDALFMESNLQRAYDAAKDLTQYCRDNVSLVSYSNGSINGLNERQKKLQELYFIAEDSATSYLEGYEEQAFKALTLATIERKRIEAEISLTKAWLYSLSGSARTNTFGSPTP